MNCMSSSIIVLLLLGLYGSAAARRDPTEDHLRLPSEASRFFDRVSGVDDDDDDDDDTSGTKWAILIAGSSGYWNYRHQVNLLSII